VLGIEPSDRVLDLGCGTGDFVGLVTGSGARAVGLDFSGAMLAEAARRRDDAELVRGDARRLPLRTASLTVVVTGFTLRNFSPLEPALAEAGRVLAPGGRLGLLEVDAPRNPMLGFGHRLYFHRLVPLLGAALSGDRAAYRYLPASASYLPEQRELVRMLQRSGFHRVRKRRLALGAVQLVTAVKRPDSPAPG
jgi:demethylmenaquinone methyltransferase / 2-methoxy-6-polyprenyl-1,4-benzoquinol methylase